MNHQVKMHFTFANIAELYQRDPKIKREDVQMIQEWIAKQSHLVDLDISELQVLLFLQSCYYSIEAAKNALDNYFTYRTHCSEIFNALDEATLVRNMAVGFLNVLPIRSHENYAAVLLKLIDLKTENFNCGELVSALNMIGTLHLHQWGFEEGMVMIFDMSGFSLVHLAKMNWIIMKKALYYLQEAIPIRLKRVHFINMVPFTDKIIALVKPFLKPELYNLLTFHPNSIESLYKYVPQKCLPKEYGGESPSIETLNETSIQNLLRSYEFFTWHDKQKIDESKRTGRPKDVDSIFGVDGTFKKLQID